MNWSVRPEFRVHSLRAGRAGIAKVVRHAGEIGTRVDPWVVMCAGLRAANDRMPVTRRLDPTGDRRMRIAGWRAHDAAAIDVAPAINAASRSRVSASTAACFSGSSGVIDFAQPPSPRGCCSPAMALCHRPAAPGTGVGMRPLSTCASRSLVASASAAAFIASAEDMASCQGEGAPLWLGILSPFEFKGA